MLPLQIQLRATIKNRLECEDCLFELANEGAEPEKLKAIYKELLGLLTEEMRLKLARIQRTAALEVRIPLSEQIVLSYREKLKRVTYGLNGYYR